MPKAHNTCQWLTQSSTKLCGKICLAEFCKIHLARIRKGSYMRPCRSCGVGVLNKQRLCGKCGYMSEWRRAAKSVQQEFERLAAIELFN